MSDADYQTPIKVTISDPETGKILQEKIVKNDYLLVTAGNRFVKHIQIWGRTHTISIGERKLP